MKAVPAEELERRVEAFEVACRRRGLKLTAQRLLVFTSLARSLQHPDAETVHREVSKKMPHISLDTVYRNLWVFVEMGVACVLSTSEGRRRFEADVSVHHHFVCRECGTISDVSHPSFDAMRVPSALKKIGTIERTCVELRGRCCDCLKKASNGAAKAAGRRAGAKQPSPTRKTA